MVSGRCLLLAQSVHVDIKHQTVSTVTFRSKWPQVRSTSGDCPPRQSARGAWSTFISEETHPTGADCGFSAPSQNSLLSSFQSDGQSTSVNLGRLSIRQSPYDNPHFSQTAKFSRFSQVRSNLQGMSTSSICKRRREQIDFKKIHPTSTGQFCCLRFRTAYTVNLQEARGVHSFRGGSSCRRKLRVIISRGDDGAFASSARNHAEQTRSRGRIEEKQIDHSVFSFRAIEKVSQLI